MPFNPNKDLALITTVVRVPEVVVVNPSLPVASLAELIAYAKANPGKINFGSAGAGGITHLACELLKAEARVDLLHVPYKGAAPPLATRSVRQGERNRLSVDSARVRSLPRRGAGAVERDHQGDRLQGRLARANGRAPAVLSRFAQPAEAQAAPGRVRRARARVRAAPDLSLRGEPALHSCRCAQGKTLRIARHAGDRALRDRPVHLPRLRQPRRRRRDRREEG